MTPGSACERLIALLDERIRVANPRFEPIAQRR